MSKIAIIINSDTVSPKALFELKKTIGTGVDEIKENILDKRPVFEGVLFYNDHDEVSEKLFKVIDELKKNDVPYSLFELEDEEKYDVIDSKNQEINDEVLRNIIEMHNREIRRQEDL
ncbi:hypothetical protein BBI01_01315 [Chryseobacterium artocarpi]|uniref:Uncharacterized protein n=1 Tax=Chryseobacterium artocarpi TaxID=1414727 RepID=A0A1B8ZZY2_9FLAO|nr:hypothetical protein [Chryseobacterium artocarpi]OCA77130.1 hypothetical protein BBI01_01315 [Chryseobacterium artocarpi]